MLDRPVRARLKVRRTMKLKRRSNSLNLHRYFGRCRFSSFVSTSRAAAPTGEPLNLVSSKRQHGVGCEATPKLHASIPPLREWRFANSHEPPGTAEIRAARQCPCRPSKTNRKRGSPRCGQGSRPDSCLDSLFEAHTDFPSGDRSDPRVNQTIGHRQVLNPGWRIMQSNLTATLCYTTRWPR